MRRILVPKAIVGRIDITGPQAHHFRDVLRLAAGEIVEVFDETGACGRGRIVSVTPGGVSVEIDEITPGNPNTPRLTIAAAVPKAARADWMIEKLSELGVDTLMPLSTRRSVVLPRGSGKLDRWRRLAAESAEQSARAGVMRIESLTELPVMIERAKAAGSALWHLSLDEDAVSIFQLISALPGMLTVFVGPEGGWSAEEADAFRAAQIVPVRLTRTILRVETAAVAAAAIIQAVRALPSASALTLTLPAATILSNNPRNPA
ncbi:MAG: RsmE family RNA methyltransferase [Tepidisphaeraceae bacterium]|jgi:16S rRNA (uracil1498-N3)-methyltransferase